LAVIEEIQGDKGKAIQDYRKVVGANPSEAEAFNNLAYLLAESSQSVDEALKYAQRSVELAPAKPAYAETLGWILYKKGLYTSAVPYLEKASSASASAIGKYHLAMAYAKTGDRRSHTVLEAALKLNANLPEAKAAQEVVGPSH
jgi:tetratricopeptide (TPR) repeat protein